MESPFEDEDRIPTYEESVGTSSNPPQSDSKTTYTAAAPTPKAPLAESLSNTRSERVHSIITTHIEPLLESQALSGLHKTTIALVPSNSNSLQTSSASPGDIIEGSGDSIAQKADEAVIGFPDEDYVKLVRLHGDEYVMEFWRQPAVIDELESSLKARLSASGHEIYDPFAIQIQLDQASAAPQSRSMPPIAKRGLFRKRQQETASTPQPPSPASEQQIQDLTRLGAGQVKLQVGLQDISLRVVTDMGLYDTKTGKALLVTMEIGS